MIPRVQNAVDLKKAIDSADSSLTGIGFDASVLKDTYDEYYATVEDQGTPEDQDISSRRSLTPDSDENTLDVPGGGTIDKTQMGLAEKLRCLNLKHKDWHSGRLGNGRYARCAYSLKVTRAGCDFEGVIDSKINDLLPQWYENSHSSGFGNVKTLETEIDVDVRNAREINSSEFTVGQKLIKVVERLWSMHFLPERVCAMPYKIHIYGPEGQFKPHKDTPEKNLVGTFLVGLGDTTKPGNHLVLSGSERYGSHVNDWVAFYPDIPHEVTRIESGYRAVIAFKIFRRDNAPETSSTGVREADIGAPEALPSNDFNVDLQVAVESVLADLCSIGKPFAFHLTHLYNKSLIEPVGFDNILFLTAMKQRVTHVRLLPVLCNRRYSSGEEIEGGVLVQSSVYPFTDDHMDFLLGDEGALERESVQWLKGLEGIPFWSLKEDWRAGVMWNEDYDEGAEYTGNESRASDEYSVYLTWAMIVFPKPV